ncbi:uncharacterized protein UBRO_20769 [Ustilago bromivora]|uniref:Uncharacterized protein n=1 Tax=Ustilago bromivora TaxID=307758 RepID=A0A1K0G793_9BASI|nr:uncharacterized protein UBRO_20769 [Ustilago bromivora]
MSTHSTSQSLEDATTTHKNAAAGQFDEPDPKSFATVVTGRHIVIGPGAQKKKCPAHESWDRAGKWVSTEFNEIGNREALQLNSSTSAEQGLYDRSQRNLSQGAIGTDLTRYTTTERKIRSKGPGDPEQQRDSSFR